MTRKLLSAILAGCCIGLGGTVYLSVESKVIGALLFGIGLYTVCRAGLDLFTGQIGHIWQTRKPDILIVLAGNIIGAILTGWLMRFATDVTFDAAVKLDKGLLRLFVLAILCNVCICIAVEIRTNISIFLGVIVFILCGFEHSIADVFYFTVAGWTWAELLVALVVIAGNAVGGICTINLYQLAKRGQHDKRRNEQERIRR